MSRHRADKRSPVERQDPAVNNADHADSTRIAAEAAAPADVLRAWLATLTDYPVTDWDKLPDIGLYMDQVQTWINRQLGLYQASGEGHLLTAAMINNYIKAELLPRTDGKKYAPTHLALLTMIGSLKQVLSMADLKTLLATSQNTQNIAPLFAGFLSMQQQTVQAQVAALQARISQLPPAPEQQQAALRVLALEWAVEARVRILLAEKMLSMLTEPD